MLSRLKHATFFRNLGKSFRFFPANVWTVMGLLIGLVSAENIFRGSYFSGVILLAVAAIIDEIDGSVARIEGPTKFGAFLDSTFDRIVDGFVFVALVPKFPIALLALIFSYTVSYTRARAECFIEKCDVGIGERSERMIVLVAGLLTGYIEMALAVITVLAFITTIWRIEYARQKLKTSNRG